MKPCVPSSAVTDARSIPPCSPSASVPPWHREGTVPAPSRAGTPSAVPGRRLASGKGREPPQNANRLKVLAQLFSTGQGGSVRTTAPTSRSVRREQQSRSCSPEISTRSSSLEPTPLSIHLLPASLNGAGWRAAGVHLEKGMLQCLKGRVTFYRNW